VKIEYSRAFIRSTVPWLLPSLDLRLSVPVTFLVGENGTGKSTLLKAIAWSVGFGAEGGNRDQSFAENADGHALGRALRLSWRQKVSGGFFLRAETFFNFAAYLEDVGSPFIAYGGKSLHQQSHGEAFLSLFQHRFEDGLYLLDEPEAALSPQRQLAFLRILHDLTAQKIAQFVIVTHSPMLLTFPGATIFSLDAGQIRPVTYQETDHFQITRVPVSLWRVFGQSIIAGMKRLQAFKFELMPNGEQRRQMRRYAGCCRFVYNQALDLPECRINGRS
jgi:predicted ATPase